MTPRLTTLNASNPLGQAFWGMRVIFAIAPILFGLDKFFNYLVDWTQYLAPWVPELINTNLQMNITAQQFMYGVGVVEIVAGILVWFMPQVFAYVVMLWLWGIIVNLVSMGEYYDIALRDFGLSIGALSLGRLAQAHVLEQRGAAVGTPAMLAATRAVPRRAA